MRGYLTCGVRWALMAALGGASACGSSPTPPTPTPGAPTISCPADVSQTSTSATAVVTFAAPTTVDGAQPLTTSCNVISGASLPVGTTAVSCIVTDALGRSASCGFNITVVLRVFVRYTKYMAFGDSLTEGQVSNSSIGVRVVDPVNNYPSVLESLLAARYVQQAPRVSNRGIGGRLADDDTSRLRDELAAGPVPDVLLLLEGSNEMTSGDAGTVALIVPALREDIETARSFGVKAVLLATFPPTRAGRLGTPAGPFIVSTNNSLRAMAAQQGAILVDLHTAMFGQENTLIGDDGLHLTVAGYRKMAETFMAAIQANFELPSAPASASAWFIR